MAYTVTFRFDPDKVPTLAVTVEKNGRTSTTHVYQDETYFEFDEYTYLQITATTKKGYTFSSFKLVGEATNAQKTSKDNPYYFAVVENVTITVNVSSGGSADEEWELETANLGQIAQDYTESLSVNQLTMYRYSFTFAKAGDAKFYSAGNLDTLAFFGTAGAINATEGKPKRYLVSDDDGNGNGNFLISYPVEAGKKYYLFVRGTGPSTAGVTSIVIIPPEQAVVGKGQGFYVFITSESRWAKATPYVFNGSKWVPAPASVFVSAKSSWISEKT